MSAVRRIARDEDGMGLTEVLIGIVLAVGLVLAVGGMLSRGAFNSLGHERQVSGLSIAEDQLEAVRRVAAEHGFEAVALDGPPGAPSTVPRRPDPDDPDDWLEGHGTASPRFVVAADYHDAGRGATPGTPANGEAVIVDPVRGRVAPVSGEVRAGSVTATVHRYVTRHDEQCTVPGQCQGDSRRVTVAVLVHPPARSGAGAERTLQLRKPLYLSTIVAAPVPRTQPGSGRGLKIGVQIP